MLISLVHNEKDKKKLVLPNKIKIIYIVIDSIFSALLVLLGAFSNNPINSLSITTALLIATITFVTKFKGFWNRMMKENNIDD